MSNEPGVENCTHLVQFFTRENPLAPNVCSFLAAPLLRGEAAVVVAARRHREVFAVALAACGLDVAHLRREGRYIELDAAETLALFMTDHGPDEELFRAVVGATIAATEQRFGAVHAYGEMVGILATEGQVVAALELEALWSRLMSDEQSFRLLCGYPEHAFEQTEEDDLALVRSAHDSVAASTARTISFALPSGPDAGAVARRKAQRVLNDWGFRDAEWNGEVALVVSELVANALRHAWSQLTITLDLAAEQVTVSVTDGSPLVPGQPTTSTFAESGRGITIIDALVDQWGVERQPRGKRVWARLHGCPTQP